MKKEVVPVMLETVNRLYKKIAEGEGTRDRLSLQVEVDGAGARFPDELRRGVEELYQITISSQEWARLRTLDEVVRCVQQKRLAYWQNRFAERPLFPVLPIERKGSEPWTEEAEQSDCFRRERFILPSEVQEKIAAFANISAVRGEDRLPIIMLAVFVLLLYRYTEQSPFIIVTPRHYFCFEVDRASRFCDYFQQVVAAVTDTVGRGDIPLKWLYETEQDEKEHNSRIVRPVSFCCLDERSGMTSFPDSAGQTAKLSLEVISREERVTVSVTYDAALYEREAIRRLLGHIQTLLVAAVSQPGSAVGCLPMITAEERRQLLVDWNNTAHEYPRDQLLHHLVEEQVRRTPDLTAVVSEQEALSYHEVNRRANQLARHLRLHGVERGKPVGVCISRSTKSIVAVLAILKANGIYVPLDPAYPVDRLTYMVENSGIDVLISEEDLVGKLPVGSASVILMDRDWPQISVREDSNLDGSGAPDDPAYIMYTSGSTGRPKGAICKHDGVVNLLSDLSRRLPLSSGAPCSLWTSFSFDVSVFEMFSALTCGGSLHIVPDNRIRYDCDRLLEWMSEQQIESAYVPPFMLAGMSDWLKKPGSTLSLKRLAVGVEPIWEPLLVEIADRIPGVAIYNIYGPSEATIYCTTYLLDRRRSGERYFPIGRPIANTRIYLLDAQLQPVPVGVPGELYIAGEGVGGGYINNPQLTAERFVDDPFDPRPGARMYRTGDRARYLSDGNIEFLGRIDFQLKIRGHRVEPGEVEGVLAQHPLVRQAIVLPVADHLKRNQLAAFVVTVTPDLQETQVQAYLRERVPSYMVPAQIRIVDTFPLNPNGKIDRKALIGQLSACEG
ncbi:MAG: amino acid adenylation domain-containing protein [Brevibacillus sp.]|nr:amino acid adenylation domain-containing protein [Brevibacillus sp.]